MATLSIVPRATACATKADGGVDIQSRIGTAWVFHGCVDFTWLDADEVGSGEIAGAVALLDAARAVDSPHELPATVASFTADLRHGWDGDRSISAFARDKRGRVTGLAQIFFTPWDNTHLGYLEVTVDPLVRRRGLGRKLFEAGVERIREEGRTLVLIDGSDHAASVAFADAMGLDRASEEVQRRLQLTTLDWTRLDHEFGEAGDRARDYELLQMPGGTPDGMLTAIARMTEAINDAPTDDLQIEDEVFSPERLRAFEAAQEARGRRLYRLVVRHGAAGELAGHTMVGIDNERPWHGWQYDTSVLRTHRGHRLGLLLKIGMVRWLAEEEPQLRTLDTWNASSNAHMIRVNEVLGYEVLARAISWQQNI